MLDYHGVLAQERILNSWTGVLQWREAARALAFDGSREAARVLAMQYGRSSAVPAAVLDEAMRVLPDGPALLEAWTCWQSIRSNRLAAALAHRPPPLPCSVDLFVLAHLKSEHLEEVQSRPLRDVVDAVLGAMSDRDWEISSRATMVLYRMVDHPVTAARLASIGTREVYPMLDKVTSQAAMDAVYRVWASRRDQRLTAFLAARRWDPAESELRVLAALKFGREVPAEAVPVLKRCWDGDADVRRAAQKEFLGRTGEEWREAACRAVLEAECPPAVGRALADRKGWHPSEPETRAVYFLLTDQFDRAVDLDYDQSMLSEAYRKGAPALRRRVAAAVRRSGRADLLRILMRRRGDDVEHLLLPDLEWDAVMTGLDHRDRVDDLWSLALDAPPRWSMEAIKRLVRHGFQPPDPDRPLWNRIKTLVAATVDWSFVEREHLPEATLLPSFPVGVKSRPVAAQGRLTAYASGSKVYLSDGRSLALSAAPWWLSWDATGTRLAAAWGGRVEVWDVEQGTPLEALSVSDTDGFAWNGRRVVAQSSLGYRTVADLGGRQVLHQEAKRFDTVALSSDGSLMAVVKPSEWRLYEVDLERAVDAVRLRFVQTMQSGARRASFSPDGSRVAIVTLSGAVSKSDGVSCYDTLSGERVLFVPGLADLPTWSTDGRFLAIAKTPSIEVWDTVDGRVRWILAVPAEYRTPGTASLLDLWMAPDNQYLLACTANGWLLRYPLCPTPLAAMHVRMWEAQERRERNPHDPAWAFLGAMLEYRNRYDIEIEEDTFVPDAFDIELES